MAKAKHKRARTLVSSAVRPRRSRDSEAIEHLYEAIDVERDNLAKAQSILGCLAIAMEYPTEGAATPYYPDVAQIAREMVRQSVDNLDPVILRRPRDRIEERPDPGHPYSANYLLTFGYHASGAFPSLSRYV